MGKDQPGLVTNLESGPKAEDWQYSRLEVMDEGGACGNAEEEVVQRATLAWGQDMGKRNFQP